MSERAFVLARENDVQRQKGLAMLRHSHPHKCIEFPRGGLTDRFHSHFLLLFLLLLLLLLLLTPYSLNLVSLSIVGMHLVLWIQIERQERYADRDETTSKVEYCSQQSLISSLQSAHGGHKANAPKTFLTGALSRRCCPTTPCSLFTLCPPFFIEDLLQ